MRKTIWGFSVAILLTATLLASAGHAVTRVYLYEEGVPLTETELQNYLAGGYSDPQDQGYNQWIWTGPAPDPFPSIAIAEGSFEYLGLNGAAIDGVFFINHGKQLVKNKKALVLWVIRIPNANERMASEFAEDLTLSLWVDWNSDKKWMQGERTIHEHLNIQHLFPISDNTLLVYYMSWFETPDVTQLAGANAGRLADKDIRHLWTRAVVACDDPDMSPDGEQIFGDYEDYCVHYMLVPVRWLAE